jgi:hypothetical protein
VSNFNLSIVGFDYYTSTLDRTSSLQRLFQCCFDVLNAGNRLENVESYPVISDAFLNKAGVCVRGGVEGDWCAGRLGIQPGGKL